VYRIHATLGFAWLLVVDWGYRVVQRPMRQASEPRAMADLDTQAVGIEIALGAGVGATTSLLISGSIAQGAGYGVAVGIILGVILVRAAPRLAERQRPKLALVGTGLVAGIVVGALAGVVGAWSLDAAITGGLGIGAAGGAVLSLLQTGILATQWPRTAPDPQR
jgi:hypothetical protein